MQNNGILNGTGGVTIVVNGNYAIGIGNNATMNLTAPSTGTFAGLVLVDLSTTSAVTQVFSNNTTLNVTGAIYLRNQILSLENNGIATSGGCTQMIARVVQISNNAWLDSNCAGTGVKPMASSPAALVE